MLERTCDLLNELSPEALRTAISSAFVPDRRGYDLRCAMNPGNIERELGWHPGQDFNCWLAAMFAGSSDNRE